MKTKLITWLLAMLPLFVAAQKVPIAGEVDLSNYPTRSEMQKAIADAIGKPTVPEVPKLDSCKRGPILTRVFDITSTSGKFQFDGKEVFGIEYEVLNSLKQRVSFGIVTPNTNIVPIAYAGLIPGAYQLQVKGSTCLSKISSQEFVISGSGTVVIPPVIVPGVNAPQTIAEGYLGHLNLDIKKDGDSYLMSDLANPGIGSYTENGSRKEYEFRYMIGSDIVRAGRNPLSNYRISDIHPIRVIKYKIKPDKVLNQWNSGDGYYDPSAGESFTYNTSIPYRTFFFPGAKSDFVNPIPSGYHPSLQNVQWGDISPDIQLPKGHVYVADPRPWGVPFAFKKGVTHISNFALPWDNVNEVVRLMKAGKTYNDVQRIEVIFKIQKSGNTGDLWPDNTSKDWWPNGAPSEEEGYQIAMRADINHALFVGEMSENESFLPPNSPAFRGFHRGLRERMQAEYGDRGIDYFICHDYIWLGGVKLNTGNNREYYKRILGLPIDQQPKNDYTPEGTLTSTNLIFETVYLDAPDLYGAQPYELIFRLNYFKALGYKAGAFLAPIHEWKPNNMLRIPYAEGDFYAHTKIPLDPNVNIANGFLTRVFGNVYVEWGGNAKVPDRLIHRNWFGTAFFWFPKGSTSPQLGFSHFKETDGYPTYYGYNGSSDLGHFSQVLFAQTYGVVEGGSDKYLRYRLDGGKWIDPTDKDYIDAYFDKRAFVHSRTLNGKTAFFYLNCFTDNSTHSLEVELPSGQIWTGKVAGNGIHAKLI